MKIGSLMLLGALASGAGATTIDFPDFGSAAGVVLNGAATRGTTVTLVPDRPFAAGALVFLKPLHIGEGFSSEFRFRVSGSGAPFGDGLAFLIQELGPAPLGPAGGALGYYGLPRSVAIEFDIYRNVPPLTDYADPNANHVAIQSCGLSPNTPAHNVGCTLDLNVSPRADLADGAVHTVLVGYSPGMLRVFLDNSSVLSANIDLPTLVVSADGNAWLSFTAATGGATATIEIASWTATEAAVPEPGTAWLFFLGLTAIMVAVRRGAAPGRLVSERILLGPHYGGSTVLAESGRLFPPVREVRYRFRNFHLTGCKLRSASQVERGESL